MQVRHQNIWVSFVYEGHRVKFKVTGMKKVYLCTPFVGGLSASDGDLVDKVEDDESIRAYLLDERRMTSEDGDIVNG